MDGDQTVVIGLRSSLILLNTVCLYFRCISAIKSFNLRISICNVSLANSVDPDQTVIVGAVTVCTYAKKSFPFWTISVV